MLIGVASVQQKEFITASAVYYREQRFAAKSAVVVVGQVFSNLVQCLTSTSLEQYLSSGTVSDIRNSGTVLANFGHKLVTVSDFRNSTILNISN